MKKLLKAGEKLAKEYMRNDRIIVEDCNTSMQCYCILFADTDTNDGYTDEDIARAAKACYNDY